MFDLSSALVLGLTLTGLVALARSIALGTNTQRIVAITCLVVGIAAVLLVSASNFSSDEVVLNRSLDSLNFWSQLVVGILLAGIAAGIWEGYTAVKNVGHNYTQPPERATTTPPPTPTQLPAETTTDDDTTPPEWK
jgi:hypothetical protein